MTHSTVQKLNQAQGDDTILKSPVSALLPWGCGSYFDVF